MTARATLDITYRPHTNLFATAAAFARTLIAQYRIRRQTTGPMPRCPRTPDEIALIANLSSMR